MSGPGAPSPDAPPPEPAQPGVVRLALDVDVCIGVGQCELLAPDVFRLDDDEGTSALVGSPWVAAAQAELLVDKCPSGAIALADPAARADAPDPEPPAGSEAPAR